MSKLQFLETSFGSIFNWPVYLAHRTIVLHSLYIYLRYSYILYLYLFIINIPFLVNKVSYIIQYTKIQSQLYFTSHYVSCSKFLQQNTYLYIVKIHLQ